MYHTTKSHVFCGLGGIGFVDLVTMHKWAVIFSEAALLYMVGWLTDLQTVSSCSFVILIMSRVVKEYTSCSRVV